LRVPVVLLGGSFAAPETRLCFTRSVCNTTVKTDYAAACAANIARGLPKKTIGKSFEPVITYPHSGFKRLEKRSFTKPTYIFCENFLRLR
jgi:hypothetical protein